MATRASTYGRSKEHHVAVGLAFLSAFKTGDIDACVEMLHPDVEWHPSPKLLDSDMLRGRDEVRNELDTLHDRYANEIDVIPEDGRQQGDHVLLVALFKGTSTF